jgi:alkylated DNA repair dioxygenase AlkB
MYHQTQWETYRHCMGLHKGKDGKEETGICGVSVLSQRVCRIRTHETSKDERYIALDVY